eukprot:8540420-Pyramimonas_sp.AAC.1
MFRESGSFVGFELFDRWRFWQQWAAFRRLNAPCKRVGGGGQLPLVPLQCLYGGQCFVTNGSAR